MRAIVDGRPASALGGPERWGAERLAAMPSDTACCWCGGPAPQGARMTRIDRAAGGGSVWRCCEQCWRTSLLGMGAEIIRSRGLSWAEPQLARLVGQYDIPRYADSAGAGRHEERSRPVGRWHHPEVEVWVTRVARALAARPHQ